MSEWLLGLLSFTGQVPGKRLFVLLLYMFYLVDLRDTKG